MLDWWKSSSGEDPIGDENAQAKPATQSAPTQATTASRPRNLGSAMLNSRCRGSERVLRPRLPPTLTVKPYPG